MTVRDALLVLADGTTFEGEAIGADVTAAASGEVVFNTVLSGYQEVLTDPSYAGQIITFTYPHIGNYGVNLADFESPPPVLPRRRGARAGPPPVELAQRGRPRRTAARLRRAGHRGHRHPQAHPPDPRRRGHPGRVRAARRRRRGGPARRRAAEPGTDGVDLVAQVTTAEPYRLADGDRPLVVAYDFGIKRTILRHLASWFDLEVVPAATHRGGRARPRARPACSSPTVPATPRRCPTPATPSPACSATCPCSGSASATSCSAERWAAPR